jgi:hypothetical protein
MRSSAEVAASVAGEVSAGSASTGQVANAAIRLIAKAEADRGVTLAKRERFDRKPLQ